jgi:16S rRNA (guanine966-N2)-methyltransferase
MRITAGLYRSRVLRAPKGDRTRPTSDRVREALFSILEAHSSLAGSRVLDLYAGTGALGLEAISRGCAHATFVECQRDAIASIRANVAALGCADRTRIVAAAAERSFAELRGLAPFDLVFADPPYADVPSGAAVGVITKVLAEGLVPAGAAFVLEHAARDAAPKVPGLAPEDERRYGDTCLSFYRHAP